MESQKIKSLEKTAAKCRRKVVRMIEASGAGHMGGALSCMDIVTALYFHFMNIDPKNPKMPERDRFILSAGHKCMAQYAALAEKGFFPEEILDTYGSLHSKIPGHPDMHKLPGVEANTGALGHGLSIATGMALGLKQNNMGSKVYVVMGDGELPEGSNWEAAAAAAHYGLDNLVVFVDNNGLQISGKTAEVMNMDPIGERFRAFGWETAAIDGNNMEEIVKTIEYLNTKKGRPKAIIAHTIKGKGISFAEDNYKYHYWKPNKDELEKAINELDAVIKEETK
ncbi:MAG TPA: transketolase [Clostridiaceae bacterium]|nr:transketolase [Clostridiaceae bacterium]